MGDEAGAGLLVRLLQFGGLAEDDEERDGSEDAETTVDKAPGERDAANGASDERKG